MRSAGGGADLVDDEHDERDDEEERGEPHEDHLCLLPTTWPSGRRGCLALAFSRVEGVAGTLAEHRGAAAAAGEVVGGRGRGR